MKQLSFRGAFTAAAVVVLALAGSTQASNVSIGAVTFWLGNGTTAGKSDGSGVNARFATPNYCVVDKNDNLYFSDYGNDRIHRVLKGSDNTSTWVGTVEGNAEGQGTAARVNGPTGLTMSNDGSKLFLGDYFNHIVRQIALTGANAPFVSTFAGTGSPSLADGTGTTVGLYGPEGLALRKANDDVFVMEGLARRVRKLTSAGASSVLAGGANVTGYVDATGTDARFQLPCGGAFDQNTDKLWVADQGNHIIRTITTGGVVDSVAGNLISGSADGVNASASFLNPFSVALDNNNLYAFVGELAGRKVRRITKSNLMVDTVINAEAIQAWTSNSVSYLAHTSSVSGLCFDSAGVMYVVGHSSVSYVGSRAAVSTTTVSPNTTTLASSTTTSAASTTATTAVNGTTAASTTTTAPGGSINPNATTTVAPSNTTAPGPSIDGALSPRMAVPMVAAIVAVLAGAILA